MSTTQLDKIKPKSSLPVISPGDTVKVNLKVVEGDKERIQPYQGVVIRVRRGAAGGSFTVRRVAYGVGIERTFPMASPLIEKVQVIRHGKVRRAKLYYLRGLSARKARIRERKSPRNLSAKSSSNAEQDQPPTSSPSTEQKK